MKFYDKKAAYARLSYMTKAQCYNKTVWASLIHANNTQQQCTHVMLGPCEAGVNGV